MFTGIVQAEGSVQGLETTGTGRRLTFALGALASRSIAIGDSIAVNGACLTVVRYDGQAFSADLSAETLRVTTLGALTAGSPVNLEPAMTLADPLGGHLVTGHVDGVGEVRELQREGDGATVRFGVPPALARYVARKGSVCIDGVSLTVNDVDGHSLLVTLVPHTLGHTIMRDYRPGTRVNIEVDLVARYVERLLGTP